MRPFAVPASRPTEQSAPGARLRACKNLPDKHGDNTPVTLPLDKCPCPFYHGIEFALVFFSSVKAMRVDGEGHRRWSEESRGSSGEALTFTLDCVIPQILIKASTAKTHEGLLPIASPYASRSPHQKYFRR